MSRRRWVSVLLLLASASACATVGRSQTSKKGDFDLSEIGTAQDVAGLGQLIPGVQRRQVEDAATRAIARGNAHGGDWDISWSANGMYRLEKTAIPGGIKDEIPLFETVLFDKKDQEIGKWPRMHKSVFVSNTGGNLVAAEMLYGTGFDFYDPAHVAPIRSYKARLSAGQFSEDGRYFAALSDGAALFTADGNLLWRQPVTGSGGAMISISPVGDLVIVGDARPETVSDGSSSAEVTPANTADSRVKLLPMRDTGKAVEARGPAALERSTPETVPLSVSTGSPSPIAAFSGRGEIRFASDTHLYRIDQIVFTRDGSVFAVVGTNECLLFESSSGNLLKKIVVGPAADDIADVCFSQDGKYLAAAVTRYPTRQDGHASCRYEVWDLVGETNKQVRTDEIGSLSFTDDATYLVCKRKARPIFKGGRRVGDTPGDLQLLTLRFGR